VNAHDAQIDEERKRAAGSAPSVEISVGRIDALLAFDRRAGLARITPPTLVIASDNDYITPCYYAKALAKEIPGARLEIVEGGGHSISKTRPEVFNRLVMDFLTD
jgi:aminoacrylate hydrolase